MIVVFVVGVKLLLKMGWRRGRSIKDSQTASLYGMLILHVMFVEIASWAPAIGDIKVYLWHNLVSMSE